VLRKEVQVALVLPAMPGSESINRSRTARFSENPRAPFMRPMTCSTFCVRAAISCKRGFVLSIREGWLGCSNHYGYAHFRCLHRTRNDLLLNVKDLSRGHRRADIRPLPSLSIIERSLHFFVTLLVHLQDFALVRNRDMRIDNDWEAEGQQFSHYPGKVESGGILNVTHDQSRPLMLMWLSSCPSIDTAASCSRAEM
jgi:hypothetical protein